MRTFFKSRTLPYLLAAGSAVGILVACAGQPSQAVTVFNARAPGESCDYSDPLHYVERASGDLAIAGSIWQIFGWQNNLQPIVTQVGADVVANQNRNDFVAKLARVTYQTSPAVSVPSDIINISAGINAGTAADEGSVDVPLITPNARKTLFEALQSNEVIEVLATFTLEGNLQSGDVVKSQPFTFPVAVYDSGFRSCAADEDFTYPGECGQVGKNVGRQKYCVPKDGGT